MAFTYTKHKHSTSLIFKLTGKLIDTTDIDRLTIDAKEEIVEGQTKLVFNLENLTFLNSTGLNGLISILTKSRTNEGETVLCCLPETITKLFLVTKLNSVFTILPNEDEAIQHLKKNK